MQVGTLIDAACEKEVPVAFSVGVRGEHRGLRDARDFNQLRARRTKRSRKRVAARMSKTHSTNAAEPNARVVSGCSF